jgi:hypothetical protein
MSSDLPPTEVPAGWFKILEALNAQHVQYVIAGSAADAIVESDPLTAAGLIVAPAPYRRNLERVARALRDLRPHLRVAEGSSVPFSTDQIANRPAVRWRLQVGRTPLDVIGSAVGDGEFSIRLWRTRAVRLTCAGMLVVCEVEFAPNVRVNEAALR